MGLASLPRNALSSWTVPYHLSFVEKFMKKNTFDHKSIRKWSARSVLETLREKERADPVEWFPEQTVKAIWQNASSPELSNKHQDVAWLVVRRVLTVRSFMHARTLSRTTCCPRSGCRGRDCHTPPSGMCLRRRSLESNAVVFVEVHPEQHRDAGLRAIRPVPQDAHRDKHQLCLEDHQLGEGRSLGGLKPVNLPAEGVSVVDWHIPRSRTTC
ncbi:hypothetical protein chiPu_0014137 [Chiloscyllium punctatum]|uniref:Uncharacterized protein n=1 Tax=Chiloscyllium punctatum TaxID=137246 RepID=A0A401SZ44_CHIPU|nr:hypothetical protein [Chiloscyllium punctatum]